MAFWTVLLKFWNQFAKPIFIAHHESHGRVVALNEVVEVERLSEDKEAATEGVPFFQLGVFGVLHDELVISERDWKMKKMKMPKARLFWSAGVCANASRHFYMSLEVESHD